MNFTADMARRQFPLPGITEEQYEAIARRFEEAFIEQEAYLEEHGIPEFCFEATIIRTKATWKILTEETDLDIKMCESCGQPVISFESGGGGKEVKEVVH